VLCGSTAPGHGTEQPTDDISSNQLAGDQEESSPDNCEKRHHTSRLSYLTWKISHTVGFSYSVPHPRRHHAHPRQPNPFGPRSSAESGAPLHPNSSRAELLQKSAKIERPPPLDQTCIRETASEYEYEHSTRNHHETQALVSPHSRHPVWDDEPNPNTPYDNPYYTRPISDTLWLPRNPLDILNLDDTINMRISITCEPGAGHLAPLPEDEQIGSALSSVFATSFGTIEDDASSVHPSIAQLNGTEVINLPAGIASRVESVGRQPGSEISLVPRPTPGKYNASTSSIRRPVALRRATMPHSKPPATDLRSFSQGSPVETGRQRPEASLLSLPLPRYRHRSPSFSALGIGLPPETPIPKQPTSATSFRSRGTSFSSPGSPGIASIISTRNALLGEAIAEEQQVVEEYTRQEVSEAEKAKESRSWLTSWMYSSVR
jgi:hypothetical protein